MDIEIENKIKETKWNKTNGKYKLIVEAYYKLHRKGSSILWEGEPKVTNIFYVDGKEVGRIIDHPLVGVTETRNFTTTLEVKKRKPTRDRNIKIKSIATERTEQRLIGPGHRKHEPVRDTTVTSIIVSPTPP